MFVAYNRGNTYFGGGTYCINRSGHFNGSAAKLGTSTVGGATSPIYLNGGTATACTMTASANRFGVLPFIDGDGVMEVGKYIDFHDTDADETDYSVRLTSSTTQLACNLQIQAPSFNATSDARLKENFSPLILNKSILDLPLYKFDFINGTKNQIGCIAQDLQKICPVGHTLEEEKK